VCHDHRAYREDNEDFEFKFIQVFTPILTREKWTEVRTALAKASVIRPQHDAYTWRW
jgi:hypothetical protein